MNLPLMVKFCRTINRIKSPFCSSYIGDKRSYINTLRSKRTTYHLLKFLSDTETSTTRTQTGHTTCQKKTEQNHEKSFFEVKHHGHSFRSFPFFSRMNLLFFKKNGQEQILQEVEPQNKSSLKRERQALKLAFLFYFCFLKNFFLSKTPNCGC